MNQAPASVWRNPVHFLAFGLGSGASPWAPGTAGTIAAIPLFLLIQPLSLAWYAAVLVITFVLGIYLFGHTSYAIGVPAHGGFCRD